MAQAILNIVLENLRSLIQKKLALFLGLHQNFKSLETILKQSYQRLVRRLRDAAYTVDDILDECATKALELEYQGAGCGLSNKVQRSCLSCFHPKHVAFRCNTAKKMKEIRERLDQIAKERRDFHLTEMVRERKAETIYWCRTPSIITETKIYGREKDEQKIVDFFVDDTFASEDLSVYPIGSFGPNDEEWTELVIIGKEIVKKCRGVPLAAKALGGFLRFKREEKEWFYVKESNLWSLQHKENSIMSALTLSYLNLPINLRQCFAFCSFFPKDEIINKQFLIELWMANGFISSNGILDVEDIGEGVCNELYWRSFFQDVEADAFGKIINFKMHDLVHDLAESVTEELYANYHLRVGRSLSSLPSNIGKLTSLRTLSMYLVGKRRGSLLAELAQLKLKGELHIKHLKRVKSVMDTREANMSSKHLKELWLSWSRNDESRVQRLPFATMDV
ncbi:hypothetical protein RJT34_06314 [Clitoria ternatea]|uniref:NB-ARC domain-containing protein n=1 Tax=Clitoria ternatea TaxID=43366 RepID=A0AAN9PT13_CLITE